MKKIVILFLAVLMCVAFLAACSPQAADPADDGDATADKTLIKIGTTATNVPVTEAAREAIEAMGYEMEVVLFQDPVQPNTALDNGDVDALFMEHEAYMQSFVDNNGYNLVFCQPPIIFGPFCLYSSKHASLDDIPDGAQITICSDASNKDRSLILLADAGLITLSDAPQYGDFYINQDIIDNPHNITFVEMDEPSIPTTLQDVDFIVPYNPTMYAGDYDVSGLLYTEEYTAGLSSLAQGVCVNGNDKDADWVKDLMAAFTSDTTKANLEAANDGSFLVVFDK
jgi:D-methionine transport system substrate-binding protein